MVDQTLDRLIARAPHRAGLDAARAVLGTYPVGLLERAARHPVRIWLLDRGESVASAALLDQAARTRRWHGGAVGIEDCAGLTVPVGDSVVVVAPWDRPALLRHELGHALSALLSPAQRRRMERLYRAARAAERLLVPLAGESIGEYVACGLAHFARPDVRARLSGCDPELAALLAELWELGSPPRQGLLDGLRLMLPRWATAPAV